MTSGGQHAARSKRRSAAVPDSAAPTPLPSRWPARGGVGQRRLSQVLPGNFRRRREQGDGRSASCSHTWQGLGRATWRRTLPEPLLLWTSKLRLATRRRSSSGQRRSTTPQYTGDGTAFDAALFFGRPGQSSVVVGIETKYHEHATAEAKPNENSRLPRYREIVERSGAFPADWEGRVLATPLQQIWGDHLLLLALLQHPSGAWGSGKCVLVYPAGNVSFGEAAQRYRGALTDDSTFATVTLEDLLDTHTLHKSSTEEKSGSATSSRAPRRAEVATRLLTTVWPEVGSRGDVTQVCGPMWRDAGRGRWLPSR